MAFNFNNSAVSGVTYSGIDYEAYITSHGDLNDYYEDSSKTWSYDGVNTVPVQTRPKHDFGESHYFHYGQYNATRTITYFNAEPVNKVIYNGSTVFELDSDGDGVADSADAFPNDASETTDSDGDGVGDNADAFPNDPTQTTAPTRTLNPQVVFSSFTNRLTFQVTPDPASGVWESWYMTYSKLYDTSDAQDITGAGSSKTFSERSNAGLYFYGYVDNFFGGSSLERTSSQSEVLDASFNGVYKAHFYGFSKTPWTGSYVAGATSSLVTIDGQPHNGIFDDPASNTLYETVQFTINI